MAECDLQHYKKEETFGYPPWCSVCERGSQRRRSTSETNEPCRRKSKELKTLVPKKYNRSQEYENMEFEYECKGQWQEKDMRYEFSRIRSNLCELPTSYISNNCQVSSNLTNPKLSNELLSFDCMKTFNVYESPINFVKANDEIENLGDMQGKPRIQKKVDSKCSLRPGNSFVKSPAKDPLHSRSEILNNYTMTKVKTEGSSASCTEYCSLADFKFHNLSDLKPVCYETSTYFDRKGEALNLSERYSREMSRLREQLLSLRSTTFSALGQISEPEASPSISTLASRKSSLPLTTNTSPTSQPSVTGKDKHINSGKMKLLKNMVDDADPNGQDATIPLPPVKSNRNKISLKTRTKMNSTKLKMKAKPKTASNVSASSNCTESECSGSDSENETNLDEVDNISEPSTDDSNKETFDSLLLTSPETSSGDSIYWLLRPSLFPNIPPYIRFNAHDYEGDLKYPLARKIFKWKLSTITPVIVRKTLLNSGFVLVRKSNTWLGTWGKHMKSPLFKTLRESQKLNHFPGTFQLGRKDRLWRNFQKMMLKYGMKEFGFLPHTYILPQEMKLLKQCWEYKNATGASDMWIIKPPASARGVGIKVINKWAQIPKKNSLVVQKYISNPYLINGSKFDLRLYVLVTSFHPLIIYLYPEGLVRFASAKYSSDEKDLKERYMHLTNYSINKLSSQYTANEDANSCEGHKWTITKLMEVLELQQVNTKALWKNLQQLVIKTIIACEPPVVQLCEENIPSRYNCYELFGIDVLLDENLKPWLLEVNISPSLHSASPLDSHVKGPLVQTLFNMVQFHLPPRIKIHFQDRDGPAYLDSRFYSTGLFKREEKKHYQFEQIESRKEYVDEILKNLTGDDVRHLARYEDEVSVKGRFEKIFPNQKSHKYLYFMEPRYYNRLFDAWETRYSQNREEGIAVLQQLCDQKLHLKVPVQSALNRSSQNTIPLDSNQPPPSKETSLPIEEILKHTTIDNQTSVAV